jgi:methylated-DNA-[protein]-cysteine S-methyltransferase
MGLRILDTPTGRLLIKSNGLAITRVAWLKRDDPIPTGETDTVCDRAAAELTEYFSGSLKTFTVPIHLEGSDLQLRVWQVMREIPFGQVLTYGDVAHQIGSEPQAVGTTCGQNPIPVIVPCHRIVGAGGKLTGFSGGNGIETKAFLLDHETGQGRLL